MSALTLVMKEVDMDAEEFVNVRAYHSRGRGSVRWLGDGVQTLASPARSDDSSGVGSLGSEEESAAPSTGAIRRTSAWKDLNSLVVASNDKQTPQKNEENDIKIVYEGRNILNLERNLHPHQWQLTSPLYTTLNLYMKPKCPFRFFEESGALDELMITCRDCKYREPICLGRNGAKAYDIFSAPSKGQTIASEPVMGCIVNLDILR